MYLFNENVETSGQTAPGAASPKDPNVAIMRREDIQTWPERNSKGVLMAGNFVMKTGKTPIFVYMTGVNQDASYETQGDVDMEQVMQKFVASHPGDYLLAHEFFQNNLGKDLILVYGSCADSSKRVYGTKCSPMRLKNNFKSNKDGNKHEFTFEQIQGTRYVPGFYNGEIPYLAPTATDVSIILAVASGYRYKVEALATTAPIVITSSDLASGSFVTLIGSGGADPATLSNGDLTGATALLADGVQWVALDGATITFEVFEDGTDTYLIERSRT